MPGISHASNIRDMEYLIRHCPYANEYTTPLFRGTVANVLGFSLCDPKRYTIIGYFELAPVTAFQKNLWVAGLSTVLEDLFKARKE